MSKSNPVHPWRLGRTRALIFTQKSLNRAKTGVPHGTPKNFPRLGRDVSTMRKTQSTKINRKINFILHGLATRRLSVKKKVTRNRDFSRPAETDPYVRFLWNRTRKRHWTYLIFDMCYILDHTIHTQIAPKKWQIHFFAFHLEKSVASEKISDMALDSWIHKDLLRWERRK